MVTSFRSRLSPPLSVLAGLAVMTLMLGSPASAVQVPSLPDSVSVTGNTVDGAFANIDIIAPCSSTTCATPGPGFVSADVAPFYFPVSGSVTCLSVTGPDQGFGTPAAPTTAVLRFSTSIGLDEVTVVDAGANNPQSGPIEATIQAAPVAGSATDCSTPLTGGHQLTDGHAAVFDAPVLPTTKDQCKRDGWRNFPQFNNQGDCIQFVNTGK